jgi:hypothetical protein
MVSTSVVPVPKWNTGELGFFFWGGGAAWVDQTELSGHMWNTRAMYTVPPCHESQLRVYSVKRVPPHKLRRFLQSVAVFSPPPPPSLYLPVGLTHTYITMRLQDRVFSTDLR